MKVYVTHCSAKKDKTLKNKAKKVTPDKLYTATPLKRFIDKCNEHNVQWAIFSDKYGIWFPHEKHEWYEKNPNTVSEQEFKNLVKNFDEKLAKYNKIYFYHNPGRFHSLYRKLLKIVKVNDKIVLFSHLAEIK